MDHALCLQVRHALGHIEGDNDEGCLPRGELLALPVVMQHIQQ